LATRTGRKPGGVRSRVPLQEKKREVRIRELEEGERMLREPEKKRAKGRGN